MRHPTAYELKIKIEWQKIYKIKLEVKDKRETHLEEGNLFPFYVKN